MHKAKVYIIIVINLSNEAGPVFKQLHLNSWTAVNDSALLKSSYQNLPSEATSINNRYILHHRQK